MELSDIDQEEIHLERGERAANFVHLRQFDRRHRAGDGAHHQHDVTPPARILQSKRAAIEQSPFEIGRWRPDACRQRVPEPRGIAAMNLEVGIVIGRFGLRIGHGSIAEVGQHFLGKELQAA